jgi:hypothetical protein
MMKNDILPARGGVSISVRRRKDRNKKILYRFLLIGIILGAIIIPTLVFAQERSVQDILTQGLIQPPAGGEDYEIADFFLLLAAILRLIFTASAILAVIYIILGGYYYVTAYGNPESIEKGKKTITWAIIGLIVSIASFAIVQFTWNTIASGEPPSPAASSPTSPTTP